MEANTKASIKKLIVDFLDLHCNIEFAYLFGSFVNEKKYNDVDIAYFSNENINSLELSVKLERLIKKPVDLIDISKVPDHLIHEISKGEIIIDKDENLRTDFITNAWSRYFDFSYYRNRYLEEQKNNE